MSFRFNKWFRFSLKSHPCPPSWWSGSRVRKGWGQRSPWPPAIEILVCEDSTFSVSAFAPCRPTCPHQPSPMSLERTARHLSLSLPIFEMGVTPHPQAHDHRAQGPSRAAQHRPALLPWSWPHGDF